MKKILCILSLISSLILCVELIFISKKNKIGPDRFYLVDNEYINLEIYNEGMQRVYFYWVYENETIINSSKYYSHVNPIETITLRVKNPKQFANGEIIDKDSTLILHDETAYLTEYKMRVANISNDYIIFENLDNVTISFSMRFDYAVSPFENTSFYAYFKEKTNLELYSYVLDEEHYIYNIKLKVTNAENTYSRQKVTVYMEYDTFIPDMFINQKCLLQDEDTYYVYQYIEYLQGKYRKKVNVEYLYSVGEYAAIKSNELVKDNIVIYPIYA